MISATTTPSSNHNERTPSTPDASLGEDNAITQQSSLNFCIGVSTECLSELIKSELTRRSKRKN